MNGFYLRDRAALADAAELLAHYGPDASYEASLRAEQSRGQGNLVRFCHWRQIERAVMWLGDHEVTGTVH